MWRDRLAAILDFAQIGEFIDRPVRQYSSGMFLRLAFALFADLDPAANVEQGEEVQTQPSTRVITAEPGAGVSAG
jgi:hypothetical protein